MDQFKPEETLRMEIGGNERLKKYFIDNGVDLNLSPNKNMIIMWLKIIKKC